MNRTFLAALGLSALVAAPALAGLNPAAPGLPTVTDTAFSAAVPNNQISAMCVDCHTVAPKGGTGGSHYVNTLAAGQSNSGGSGISNTGAIVTSDDGKYFKVQLWSTNNAQGTTWPSKYGNAYVSTVNQLPTGRTSMNATVLATTGAMDLICESCHNVVGNENGGNNLLATQPNNEWEDTPIAEICVGCHGFMYSNNGAVVTASAADNNLNDLRNNIEIGSGRKGNNEYHWVRGTAYPQNHHVMTGDSISGVKAAAAALWTDNLIIAYADHDLANNYAGGTLPQKSAWVNIARPAATTDMACTHCHAPAHEDLINMPGAVSPAGSILRGALYTGAAGSGANIVGSRIERISDRGGWKKINDLTYCTQCHIN